MFRQKFSSRLFRLACAVVCALVAGPLLGPALAQTPSAEQIEIFQNLPPEQQQSILESLESRRRGHQRHGPRPRADRGMSFRKPYGHAHRANDNDTDEGAACGRVPAEPRLKGKDTVLLTLEIRQFERPAPEVEERERHKREQNRDRPARRSLSFPGGSPARRRPAPARPCANRGGANDEEPNVSRNSASGCCAGIRTSWTSGAS